MPRFIPLYWSPCAYTRSTHEVVRGCRGRVVAQRNQRLEAEVRRSIDFEKLQDVVMARRASVRTTGVVFSAPPWPRSRGRSERDVFAFALPDGMSLTPSGGSKESAASDRIVIQALEDGFALRMNGPTKVSPARNRMVSPGAAASMAG